MDCTTPAVQPPRLDEGERAALADRFVAGLAALGRELKDPARALLERISGPNWALEWSLAHWLGAAWGLNPDTQRQIALANVYMLGYMRVTDDLADGDELPVALPLAMALQHLWVMQYVRLFGGGSTRAEPAHDDDRGAARFWRHFESDLSRWLSLTLACRQGVSRPFAKYGEEEFAAYAGRGAPIRTSAVAAALLAGRDGADIDRLLTAIDLVMFGVVLLDEEFDWAADLEAGRNNAFIAYCSDAPQIPEMREANRWAVQKEIFLGRSGGPYFALIQQRLELALQSARTLGCASFAEFIVWYQAEVAACEAWLLRQKQDGLMRLLQERASPEHEQDVRQARDETQAITHAPSAAGR